MRISCSMEHFISRARSKAIHYILVTRCCFDCSCRTIDTFDSAILSWSIRAIRMATQSKLEKLRSSAFFQEFPPEYFEQLVSIGREIELPARTTVFKEYDRAKDVYVIL